MISSRPHPSAGFCAICIIVACAQPTQLRGQSAQDSLDVMNEMQISPAEDSVIGVIMAYEEKRVDVDSAVRAIVSYLERTHQPLNVEADSALSAAMVRYYESRKK